MDKVNNLSQAKEWFLNNHSGGVICFYGKKEQVCISYKEAEDFFFTAAQKHIDSIL